MTGEEKKTHTRPEDPGVILCRVCSTVMEVVQTCAECGYPMLLKCPECHPEIKGMVI